MERRVLNSVLLLVFGLMLVFNAFNQLKAQTDSNKLRIHVGYPTPNSRETFKDVWEGKISLDGSYCYFMKHNMFLGAIFNYSGFKINKSKIDLNTKGNYYSLHVLLGYAYYLAQNTILDFNASIGYTWINYENKDFDFSMDENGFSFLPRIDFEYLFINYLGFDISLSYPIVFEEFANDRGNDDSTIRWWDVGMGLILYF